MSAGTPPLTAPASRLSFNWIISPRIDLVFFIGAALGGYFLFTLQIFREPLGLDMAMVYFIWLALIDAPHFFDTYSRTYLDREEMRKRRRLLLGSIGLLAIGPLAVFIGYLMYQSGSDDYMTPFLVLGSAVGIWAYWHVVRQHYGIMSLYKRKSKDFAPIDGWVDKSLLYVGLLAPFVALVFRHPEAQSALVDLLELPLVALGGPALDVKQWLGNFATVMFWVSVTAVSLAVLAFVSRQAYRWIHGMPINGGKVLFFCAVIPLHSFVLYHPAVLFADLFLVSAFVTIFHDFQYHAIVWHYQRNRCHGPDSRGEQYGMATKISRSVFTFFGLAVLWGVVGAYIGCLIDIIPGCMPVWRTNELTLFGPAGGGFPVSAFFTSIVLGFLMHHYFVDQFIWRPSKDEKLRKDLKMAEH